MSFVWPFSPNWRSPVEVTQEFRTDITTSRRGQEQRRSLRSTPRKTVKYSLMVARDDLRAFGRTVAREQNASVALPDPVRKTYITDLWSAHPKRADVPLPLPPWLAAGQTVIVDSGDQRSEMVVDTVSPLGEVYFTENVSEWFLHATIRLGLVGLLDGALRSVMPTSAVTEVSVTFSVDPGTEVVVGNDEVYDILAGREVFTRRFNWANGLDLTHQWDTEQVDFGHGRRQTYRPIDFSTTLRKATFVQQGPQDVYALESFFWRNRGQRGEFYVPSGLNDLPLAAVTLEGSANLTVIGTETYDTFHNNSVYRAISIHMDDGRRIYRRVVGMFVSGSDTVLQCDRSFLTDIDPERVIRVSWLLVYRLASDQFTQQWLTDGVAQTSLAMQSMEDLPAEDAIPDLDGAGQWLLEGLGEAWFTVFDEFHYAVNIAYPAVHYWELGWCNWHSTDESRRTLNWVVNRRYPAIF